MALVKCKECGKEISTKADACPSCGAKRGGGTKAFSGCLSVLVSLVLMVGFMGWVAGWMFGNQQSPGDMVKELEGRCRTAANGMPADAQSAFFKACVAGGKSQLP